MHVTTRAGSNLLREVLLICLALLWIARATAQTNAAPVTNSPADVEGRNAEAIVISNQEALRSSLQLQEDLHNTKLALEKSQLAIEKNRNDAEEAAARQNAVVESRLKLIEQSIASQRLDELKDLQRSNRLVIFAAGAFAVVGFIVLLFAAFVQWTAVSRLTALSARLPQALGAGTTPAALGMGEAALLGTAGEPPTVQLLGVIEKLEKRIDSIEKTGHNGEVPALSGLDQASADTEGGTVALLIGKGQTLLKLDKPEEAIVCFDKALAMDPGNTDVLVRKGAALERLQKMDEAIACYDQAIAADNTMTMAYLYKGGVFNRMERYSEALECYEQALKTQQKGPAANVIIEN